MTFTLLQRANGRKVELPAEPKLSPDRARLVTADFCARRCSNELAVWRVTRDGVRKEYSWKPTEAWADAAATWKDADTLVDRIHAPGAGSGSDARAQADRPRLGTRYRHRDACACIALAAAVSQ